ncbi:MAG: branched-chain amino acid transport system permease protein [Candidatus Eremiobacteraeota bacterium]|jgi:branched-chain amino acid transport system permease protein|nr:branched-chain amino acid transport system permease protein [Candidatus Eremiobacteraeota bacterium]MEA2721650.1 branched-chain amino acid transport system permease protein [Candidatus Eremiobacteraeota bacterium]
MLTRVAIAAIVIAVIPWIVPSFLVFDLIFVAAFTIAILGLIVLTGMNGQISLGHGAFMALGGYVVAVLAHNAGWPYWLGVPLAAIASGAFGVLIGLVALRLEGVYLALATFSLAVATPSFLKHYKSITGGFGGMSLDPVQAPAWAHMDGQHWLYYVAWAVAGAAFLASALLVHGKLGRALRALRDNPIAAISFGVNPYYYKTLAFGWSAVLAGVAGAFYAIPTAYVSPDTFTVALSITLLIGAVLGGITTFWGALAGGLVVEFLPMLAQRVNAGAPGVTYGVALVLVMLFLPDGIVGGFMRAVRRIRPAPAHRSAFETPAATP